MFSVGEKVVCVNAGPLSGGAIATGLREGECYTICAVIAGTREFAGTHGVDLLELPFVPYIRGDGKVRFNSYGRQRFRKLPRVTDFAAFKSALLSPVDLNEKEGV